MTVPGHTVIFVAGVAALVLVGAMVEPALFATVLVGDALLAAMCVLEGRLLSGTRVTVERQDWNRLEIDRRAEMTFRIENISPRVVVVSIRQLWPTAFEAESHRLEVRVAPAEVVRVAFEVTPRARGRWAIDPATVDIRTPRDLARRRRHLDDACVLSVYPNLREVAEFDTLRRHRALRQFGIHRMRMVGTGREFDQLRDYLPDDEYRDINWMATARRRKPITNVYQAERSQDVMLCLDCGRMMGNPVAHGTALDRAIGASIVLAHVCCRASDRVGLALFRDTVHRYIKPVRGNAAVSRMIEELVDVGSEGVFPSYAALVSQLRANQTKRSLVFLFTDLNDPQLASNLTEVLPLVSRRHVFVVVSLRDPLLEQVGSGPTSHRRGLYQVLAARQLGHERDARVRELIRAGVQVLEVDADSITLKLINAYLEIKMRQMV